VDKGFKVLMDDGNELTVSLKDYPHPEYAFRPFSLYWTDNTFHRNGAVKKDVLVMPITQKGISDEK
jgi:hypothetical protein